MCAAQPMRAALWTVRALLLAFCALDLWLIARAAQFGPGILVQSPEGGTIRLLPVQWAATGYAWLAGLISFQLLLIAAELVLRGKLRRHPPLAGVSPTR